MHFSPTNTFWTDFPELNSYVARCQSFLQAGKADNDILLYFPFTDRIADPGRSLLQHFSGGGPKGKDTKFRQLAEVLIDKGYAIDYISDKQILDSRFEGAKILTSGSSYKTIVVPACQYVPMETLTKLAELAEEGASIIFS